jgi:phage terminase large subunit-like protein
MARNVNKFTNAANKYARDIVAGKIPACLYVKQSCQRHLDDLKKSKSKGYKWRFEPRLVEKVCSFVSNLVHIKGALRGKKIDLEPWECFLIGVPFGWISKITGFRRFNDVYAEIPRKNAKSTIGAALGLYLLTADNEPGAEIYAGAGSEDQAHQVFRPAWLMAKQSPGFSKYFGLEFGGTAKYPGTIYQKKNDSFFNTVIGKPGDGANVHGGIVDEYHEHKTDELYDTLNTGMGARNQGIMITITTAGTNTAGPCKKKSDAVKKVLAGKIKNDRTFGIIYSLDKGDDWSNFKNWKKANPNFGVSVSTDFLKQQLLTAIQRPEKANIIRCKHLNQWLNVNTAWLDMLKWNACKDETLTFEKVKNLPCVVAMDLASKIDLCSLIFLFFDENKYYAFSENYAPRETVDKKGNEHYQQWEHEGLLTVTPGAVTDYSYIEDDIVTLCKEFNVESIVYDPFQATYIATRVMNTYGFQNVVELGATVKNFSEPMKEVEKQIYAENLYHNNSILDWAMGNVVAHVDKKDNIYPNKERAEDKIDPAVALIMAMNIALRLRNKPQEPEPEILII